MAKDPAFLFYPGDYLRDTQCLSEKTQVAYDRIMCEHMRNICISYQQLKLFSKYLNEEELEELKTVLIKIDGGYQIPWVAESIVKRREYSESRRRNRQKKDNNLSKTYDEHMENEDVIETKDKNIDKKERINFQKIIDLFNSNCYELSKVWRLTQSRKSHIKAIVKEFGTDAILIVFEKVASSKFLNGGNEKGWKANFDWIFKPNNFIKILEDNYKTNGPTKNPTAGENLRNALLGLGQNHSNEDTRDY